MHQIKNNDIDRQFAAEQLRELSTLGALSDSTVHWLLHNGRVFTLEDGETLFSPGEPGNSLFVILDGEIAYEKFHNGHYTHTRDYQRGEQIGFVSLVALHDRVGRATARGETTVVEISSILFHQLHQAAPTDFGLLLLNLSREMARTIRVLNNTMVDLSHKHDEDD